MSFFNDISLGYYYPGDSFVHRLDPRTKLISFMLLMTTLLVTFRVTLLFGFFIVTCMTILSSRIPVSLVLRNLRPFAWLFAITVLVHIFWTEGRIVFTMPLLNTPVTREGLSLGLVYSVRLALLVILAAVLTLTTSPIELTDALEKFFNPFKRFRLPIHEIIIMLTLSLRFIPTLSEEALRIKNAQISRGATFDGSLMKRMRSVVPLVLPLFVSAFRRADELAWAMDSRCYTGGEGRTSYKRLHFEVADYCVLAFCSLMIIMILIFGLSATLPDLN
jgi:energy-coupling factor transport system permease protein